MWTEQAGGGRGGVLETDDEALCKDQTVMFLWPVADKDSYVHFGPIIYNFICVM